MGWLFCQYSRVSTWKNNQLAALFPYDICSLNRYTTEGDCQRRKDLVRLSISAFQDSLSLQPCLLSWRTAFAFFSPWPSSLSPSSVACRFLVAVVCYDGLREMGKDIPFNVTSKKIFKSLWYAYMTFTDTWHSRTSLDLILHLNIQS